MADSYELEYKKIHNTLTKDADPNNFGDRIGQRVDNLLAATIIGARELASDVVYGSYTNKVWRDSMTVTEALSYDFLCSDNLVDIDDTPKPDVYHASDNIEPSMRVVNADFYTPLNYIGPTGKKVYYPHYRKGWYQCINGAVFFPWTLSVNWADIDERIYDVRGVFIDGAVDGYGNTTFPTEDIYGSNANKTFMTHKIVLEQDEDYIFQLVNRYNEWPPNAKIYVQFVIENEGQSYNPVILPYCQTAFKPILLNDDEHPLLPEVAFKLHTPKLEKGQYRVPSYIADEYKLRLRGAGSDANPPYLLAIFYITNITKTNTNMYIEYETEEEGSHIIKRYDLDEYRFFLFKSSKAFQLSENGTILSYQSLRTYTTPQAIYGGGSVVYTVYDDIRPVLNRTRPLLEMHNTGEDADDPYIGVRFTPILTVNNAQDLATYFGEFKEIYYVIGGDSMGNDGYYLSIYDDYSENYYYSTTIDGEYTQWSLEEFIDALSENGRLYFKTSPGSDYEICGYGRADDGVYRRFSSGPVSAAKILETLRSEGWELILIPFHDQINRVHRDRSWEWSNYSSYERYINLRMISSNNRKGKYKQYTPDAFRQEVELYYAPSTELRQRINKFSAEHITGWRCDSFYQKYIDRTKHLENASNKILVESTSSRYIPFVHIGVFRFPVFYNDIEHFTDDDLLIKFYVQPGNGIYQYRPVLKITDADYNPCSGSNKTSSISETLWYNKGLKDLTWCLLDMTRNSTAPSAPAYDKELIAYDEATTKYSSKAWYYKADGKRQAHLPEGFERYAYRALEVHHDLSHGFLYNYERSFLPWVARMRFTRNKTISIVDSSNSQRYKECFVGISFRWGLISYNAKTGATSKTFQEHLSSDWRIVGSQSEQVLTTYGDRFGLWGNSWAEGFRTNSEYKFPMSNTLYVSQYVGVYYPVAADEGTHIVIDNVEYDHTKATYIVPGRKYHKTAHALSEKNQPRTIDLGPYCWGAGKMINVRIDNRSDLPNSIAVVDYHERDEL